MRLACIRIEKFRAIRSCELIVGTELALVGKNGSGKSSILRALNAFFHLEQERDDFQAGRHAFDARSNSIIDLEFSGVPEDVELVWTYGEERRIRIRLKARKRERWEVLGGAVWQVAPPGLMDELKKHVDYVYIPNQRDHRATGWDDGGLLRKAIESNLGSWMRDRVSPVVKRASDQLEKRAFNPVAAALQRLIPVSGDLVVKIGHRSPPDYRSLLSDVALSIGESGGSVDLQDCGSGTQSLVALALYSHLADQEQSTYILGIEEPEQNLHPQAQRELLASLKDVPLQVVFTTHSTVMLDELDHEEVALCRRVDGRREGIEVVTAQLGSSFWESHGLDRANYHQFYRYKNSDVFFADFVAIVESPIDAEVVRALLENASLDVARSGASLLNIDGVGALPYAFHMLRALDIPFVTVLDKDYFLPYLNDKRSDSLDARGFPRYRSEFRRATLIESMVPEAERRQEVLQALAGNHTRAMELLEEANVYCYKWSLEVDLVNCEAARELLYQQLGVAQAERAESRLLVEGLKQIKKLENLLTVVRQLTPQSLPHSYKRLRRTLPGRIRAARR